MTVGGRNGTRTEMNVAVDTPTENNGLENLKGMLLGAVRDRSQTKHSNVIRRSLAPSDSWSVKGTKREEQKGAITGAKAEDGANACV